MIISQLSISPVGKGVSVSRYVKLVIDALEKSGVKYKTNAMSTVIETEDIDTIFKIVKNAHDKMVEAGAERIITEGFFDPIMQRIPFEGVRQRLQAEIIEKMDSGGL